MSWTFGCVRYRHGSLSRSNGRDHVGDEPVFIVIYEGNPNEGETAVECCTPCMQTAQRQMVRLRGRFRRTGKHTCAS